MKNLAYVGSIVLSAVATVFSLNSARAVDNTCGPQYCTIHDLYSNIYNNEVPYVLPAGGAVVAGPWMIIRRCIRNCPQPGSKDRRACVLQCRAPGPGGHD
jgi:hypothetical protein